MSNSNSNQIQLQYQPFDEIAAEIKQPLSLDNVYQIQNDICNSQNQNNQNLFQNGLKKLTEIQGVYIKQKLNICEALTCIEQPNSYAIYPADANGQQIGKQFLFKSFEKSTCLERNCMGGDCRPFEMSLLNFSKSSANNYDLSITPFLFFKKSFQMTFCCFNRPYMQVFFNENQSNTYLGEIYNPLSCSSFGCDVKDATGQIRYQIRGAIPQWGCFCRCIPLKVCQEYTFNVMNAQGVIVSKLQKQFAGCIKACMSDADNFSLVFPEGISSMDKALLISASIFLDYIYFEKKTPTYQKCLDCNVIRLCCCLK